MKSVSNALYILGLFSQSEKTPNAHKQNELKDYATFSYFSRIQSIQMKFKCPISYANCFLHVSSLLRDRGLMTFYSLFTKAFNLESRFYQILEIYLIRDQIDTYKQKNKFNISTAHVLNKYL